MERSPVAVPIVAGTAIRGMAANVMMNGVLRRHPNAFLVTLERWGVSVRLDESQTYLRREIRTGLMRQNLSLIHISEPTRQPAPSRMPSSA